MTGTASSFTDLTENVNCKSRNIHLLTTWLLGRVNTDCILADITHCGGSVLIPRKRQTPSGLFDLVIMSPAKPHEAMISIRSEQRWIDNDFSIRHKKIGFKFHDTALFDNSAIDSIIELLLGANSDIKCSILSN